MEQVIGLAILEYDHASRFDRLFFTSALRRLIGAPEPLTEEQELKVWSAPRRASI